MTRNEIELACDLAWQKKFIELIGHKIGDEVECTFFPNSGNSKSSYVCSVIDKGIIVETDKGIFVKSNKQYDKSYEVRRYPNSSTSLSTYWAYRKENLLSHVRYIKQ